MTYRSKTQGAALHSDPWSFSKQPGNELSLESGIFETGDSTSSGKHCTRLVELPDSAPSVMLALPNDVIRDDLVQSEAEWRFVLPHLSCHAGCVLTEFIGNTVSVCIEDKTTDLREALLPARNLIWYQGRSGLTTLWDAPPRLPPVTPDVKVQCPNSQCLKALDRLGLRGLNDLFNDLQLWALNYLLNDLHL